VAVSSFSVGITSPVTVTATEINQTIPTDVELTATDTAGLVTTGSFEFGSVSAPEPPTVVDLDASFAALAFAAAMCSRRGFRRSRS
jgi:hypothetical protein